MAHGVERFYIQKGMVDMAHVDISMQMDEQLKMQADKLFADLGLNMASAVNLFVKQAVREQQIPFVISKGIHITESRVVQTAEPEESMSQDVPIEEMIGAADLLEDASARTYSMGMHKM